MPHCSKLPFDENIGLRTGDFMDISMQVIAASGGGAVNAGYAEGFLDPLFVIDPAYASMYTREGVPQPGAGALVVAGLAPVGAIARRRRVPPGPVSRA